MNIVCALTFDAAEDATLASAASLARMLSAQLRKRAWWRSVPHDSRIRQLIESVDCPVMVIPHGGTFTAHGNRRSGKKGNRKAQ